MGPEETNSVNMLHVHPDSPKLSMFKRKNSELINEQFTKKCMIYSSATKKNKKRLIIFCSFFYFNGIYILKSSDLKTEKYRGSK